MRINENVEYHNTDILEFSTNVPFDFVYCDPPYRTQRAFTVDATNDTGFCDVWKDDKAYASWFDRLVSRVKGMLKPRGTLAVHVSSDISFVAETVVRAHFKHVQKVYWKRCHGKNAVKNKLAEVVDVIFVCHHNTQKHTFNRLCTNLDSAWAFKFKDDVGAYNLGALKHDRTRRGHMYSLEHEGVAYNSPHGWKKNEDDVKKLVRENKIHFCPKQHNMYVKVYQHEHEGVPLSNLWTDIHSITRTNKDPRLYPTQKPQKLLERLIRLYTNEGDRVLDPACGSGTTAYVADALKRKCVVVDKNPDTLAIVQKRFLLPLLVEPGASQVCTFKS